MKKGKTTRKVKYGFNKFKQMPDASEYLGADSSIGTSTSSSEYDDAGPLDEDQPMNQNKRAYNTMFEGVDCSVEQWKQIPGVSDEYKMYISSWGHVRTVSNIRENRRGRRFVNIHGIMYPIDVLVASLFTENPTKSELVVHTDSSVGNDRVDNLCWVPNKTVEYPVITSTNITTRTYQHKLYPRQTLAMMKDMMHRMILDKILVPLMPGLARCQRQVIYDGIGDEMNDEVLEYLREKYPYLMPDDFTNLGDEGDKIGHKWCRVKQGNNEYLLTKDEYVKAINNKA